VRTERYTIAPSFDVSISAAAATERQHPQLLARCREVVSNIRFDATTLPICALTFEARASGVMLVVDMLVPDRDVLSTVEYIHIWRSVICPWAPIEGNGPEYLVRWMRETIANTLAHEVDECIALNGRRVFDPHQPLISITVEQRP
jgi:hypothetical protein